MRHPLLLLIAALAPSATAAAPPRRVVSLNLCADQFLLALADRSQVAALTRFARDPAFSADAKKARAYPFSKGSAEELLALQPDLVITSPWRRSEIVALLAGRGVRVVDVPDATDYPGIRRNAVTVATLLGHPERGRSLVAHMDAALARVGPPAGRGRTAAYWQRRGFLTGGGTLVDDMMRRSGLVNLATRLGRPALSRLPVELLVAHPPDFLFLDREGGSGGDRGSELLHHPAVDRAVPRSHRLRIPQALSVCGAPGYPRAIAAITAQIRAADRKVAR